MKLIVGLGNPGKRYTATRHNIGRDAVDTLASDFGLCLTEKKLLKASLALGVIDGQEAALAYPSVFMNLSGETVARLVREFSIKRSGDLLVVVDDLALPFGKLRLRAKGSSGGHNGLKSIEALVGTSNFARLRIGIGHPGEAESEPDVSTYVLSRFSENEKKCLPEVLAQAADACRVWLKEPVVRAMEVVNHCR